MIEAHCCLTFSLLPLGLLDLFLQSCTLAIWLLVRTVAEGVSVPGVRRSVCPQFDITEFLSAHFLRCSRSPSTAVVFTSASAPLLGLLPAIALRGNYFVFQVFNRGVKHHGLISTGDWRIPEASCHWLDFVPLAATLCALFGWFPLNLSLINISHVRIVH